MRKRVLLCILGVCTFALLIFTASSQALNKSQRTYQVSKYQHTGPVYTGKDLMKVRYASMKGDTKKGCT